ncbi:MAG: cytochrome C nitrite reductase [Sphingomonadales bacterium]|jgi:hypothetical protein
MRHLLPLLLLLAAAPPPTRPVAANLPDEEGFFADLPQASADTINGNCLACHSAAMVLNQPVLTRTQWAETLAKMRTAFHAPIDPADDAAILDWLLAQQAAKQGH